jgi:hypothetical protein
MPAALPTGGHSGYPEALRLRLRLALASQLRSIRTFPNRESPTLTGRYTGSRVPAFNLTFVY